MARRECIENLDRRFARESGGQELGRLSGAYEGTRENLIDAVIELVESLDHLFETGDASLRQRALVVVGPVLTPISGNRVTDQIQLAGARHGGLCGRRLPRSGLRSVCCGQGVFADRYEPPAKCHIVAVTLPALGF